MIQSRAESAVESTLNIATGFVISWAVWVFVVPVFFGAVAPGDPVDALWLTGLFTITSWLRSYAWRRWFTGRRFLR